MRAVLSLLLAGVVCVAAESSYDELYLEGVDAYSGENWKDTIAKVKYVSVITDSIGSYGYYHSYWYLELV